MYFTSDLFSNFVSYFHSACSKNPANCGGKGAHHECYHFDAKKYESFENFAKTFPEITFQFNESDRVKWLPRDYLAVSLESQEHFCIGVKSLKTPILGALFMKNFDVHFDRVNKKISMIRANCGGLEEYSLPEEDRSEQQLPVSDPLSSVGLVSVSEEVVEEAVNLVNNKHSKKKARKSPSENESEKYGLRSFRLAAIVIAIILAQILAIGLFKYCWSAKKEKVQGQENSDLCFGGDRDQVSPAPIRRQPIRHQLGNSLELTLSFQIKVASKKLASVVQCF